MLNHSHGENVAQNALTLILRAILVGWLFLFVGLVAARK